MHSTLRTLKARSSGNRVQIDQPADRFLVDERETAWMLKLSLSKLRKFRLTGDGPPFVKIGKLVRYRIDDLRSFTTALVSRTVAPKREPRHPR